jgi:hypothetical protein
MSNIFTKLLSIIKTILPFLKDAAQRAYEQLPVEAQDKLKDISRVVEAVKQLYVAGQDITADGVAVLSGVASGDVEKYLITYAKSKGVDTDAIEGAVAFIKKEADVSTDTGKKSLWSGLFHIVAEEFSHIDWRTLLMGVGQFVFDEFVKGKIKI